MSGMSDWPGAQLDQPDGTWTDTYRFPTFSAVYWFAAYNVTHRGRTARFEDGSVLTRKADSVGKKKSLVKSKKQKSLKKAAAVKARHDEWAMSATENPPNGYPVVSLSYVPATMYRLSGDKLVCMVTEMPDGLHIAWDTCGGCAQWFTNCTCRNGLTPSTGIQYIFERTDADMKGVPYLPPALRSKSDNRGRTSFIHPWREKPIKHLPGYEERRQQKLNPPPPKSLKKYIEPPAVKHLPKSLTKPPSKTLRKPDVVVTETTDLSEYDGDAAKSARKSLAGVLKKLKKS